MLRPDGTLWLNMGDGMASGEVGRHDGGIEPPSWDTAISQALDSAPHQEPPRDALAACLRPPK